MPPTATAKLIESRWNTPTGRQAHPPCLTLKREAQTATIARQGKGADTQPPTWRPHQPPGLAPRPALDPSTAAQANHSHTGLVGLNTGLPGCSCVLSLGGSAPEGDYFSEMSFLMGWGPSL